MRNDKGPGNTYKKYRQMTDLAPQNKADLAFTQLNQL
jgi:hypothetical protein